MITQQDASQFLEEMFRRHPEARVTEATIGRWIDALCRLQCTALDLQAAGARLRGAEKLPTFRQVEAEVIELRRQRGGRGDVWGRLERAITMMLARYPAEYLAQEWEPANVPCEPCAQRYTRRGVPANHRMLRHKHIPHDRHKFANGDTATDYALAVARAQAQHPHHPLEAIAQPPSGAERFSAKRKLQALPLQAFPED